MRKSKFKRYDGTNWEEITFLPITVDNVTIDTSATHGLKVTSNNVGVDWGEGIYVCTASDNAATITCGDEGKAHLISMVDYHINGTHKTYIESRYNANNCFTMSFLPNDDGSKWQVAVGSSNCLDHSGYSSGTMVVGCDGTDKIALGYTNDRGASVGAISTGCNSWAPLALRGTKITFVDGGGLNVGTVTTSQFDINTHLTIRPNSDNYREGIRIHPHSNGYAGITLCGIDNGGDSGTSDTTWNIHNHYGKLGILKSVENSGIGLICDNDNVWMANGKRIATVEDDIDSGLKAKCVSRSNGYNSKPWHRFATISLKKIDYADKTLTILIENIFPNYFNTSAAFSLNLRTNVSTAASNLNFYWIFRNASVFPTISAAFRNEWENTYLDLFYLSEEAYDYKKFRLICGGDWSSNKSDFTFLDSNETASESIECYESIEAAGQILHGQEYSSISSPVTDIVAGYSDRAYADENFDCIATTYAKKTEIPTVSNGKLTIQTEGTEKGAFTANSASDVTINIKASDLGLSGAMKFIGTTTSGISEGSDMQSILVGTETVTAETGNVVLKGDKEFIWTGSKWEELGDEQSHALKSITVKGTGILSGGGSLEANREITHNKTVRTDSSTMSATPGFGQSFTAIGGIGSDSYGHINAVDTKTIVIPNTIASQSASGLMSASDKTKLDGIASGANNMTYALSSDGATVTLTPSSGEAQSVTVDNVANADYATRASKDYDGNIISSTYVKASSEKLLSKAALGFANAVNYLTSPSGIPFCGYKDSQITNQLTGETVNTRSYIMSMLQLSQTTQTVAANSVSSTASRTYAVQRNSDYELVVNVPWTDTVYSLPTATASTLGGIKTTFNTASSYGLTFTNGNYGISLKGYNAGIQFAAANYRITDIETGTISLGTQEFTAGTSVAKSVTFHNTSYINSSGATTSGAKEGNIRVFLQFVGYNGEYMTCGLINLSDTGFTAYVRSTDTLTASSTRSLHWIKVREY